MWSRWHVICRSFCLISGSALEGGSRSLVPAGFYVPPRTEGRGQADRRFHQKGGVTRPNKMVSCYGQREMNEARSAYPTTRARCNGGLMGEVAFKMNLGGRGCVGCSGKITQAEGNRSGVWTQESGSHPQERKMSMIQKRGCELHFQHNGPGLSLLHLDTSGWGLLGMVQLPS